jgi:hypothetical protein
MHGVRQRPNKRKRPLAVSPLRTTKLFQFDTFLP